MTLMMQIMMTFYHSHKSKGNAMATLRCWKNCINLYPGSSVGKEAICNAGDPSFPGLGKSAGEGISYPLQDSWTSLVAQLVRIHLQCERLPIPVFWPREFHGLYSSLGRKESDRTERLSLSLSFYMYIQIYIYSKNILKDESEIKTYAHN